MESTVQPVEQHAVFACGSCEHEFAGPLPPMDEELPKCPECVGIVRVQCASVVFFSR